MPHVVMEYTDPVVERVNVSLLLEDLHKVVTACPEFNPADVKSRSYASHQWFVGEEVTPTNFIHVRVWILNGRSEEIKKELTGKLLDVMKAHAVEAANLSVDIQDMDRAWYARSDLML